MQLSRVPGTGWIVLIGGGEFSFGDTEAVDRAWVAKVAAGSVGFLPAASGSIEYGGHFASYMKDTFDRDVETIPVYRARDGRRQKNCDRIASVEALYIGGGVTNHLLQALLGSPALDAMEERLRSGGSMIAIAAAAQTLGVVARDLFGGGMVEGLGWLPDGAVETNFDPSHDRRLRQLLEQPGVYWGLGLPAGSAVLLGPNGELELVGKVFYLEDASGALVALQTPSKTE